MAAADRAYKHTLLTSAQACKRRMLVCGDLVAEERSAVSATFVVLDGIGSGLKANVAAQLFSSRLLSLLRHDFSTREACARLMATMHSVRTQDVLFAAFSLVKVSNSGAAVIMSYEMPPPLLFESGAAAVARQRFYTLSNEVVGEALFSLEPGNGFMVVTDGITQAGLGGRLAEGWGIAGARDFANRALSAGRSLEELPRLMLEEAKALGGGAHHDDATAGLFTCRPGRTVHILTGPPAQRSLDGPAMIAFLKSDGMKVICGSTTADIFARHSGRKLTSDAPENPFEPPERFMEGVDMVTEGALTLNQLYNLMGERDAALDADSTVAKLLLLLRSADRIYFHVGGARNPGHGGQIFRQLGVLPRRTIVPLIADRLRAEGKLVIIQGTDLA
jgi:hypothetical protein